MSQSLSTKAAQVHKERGSNSSSDLALTSWMSDLASMGKPNGFDASDDA
jgi:hypothetical protein